jgi:CheY-like chemotaxis protein
MEADSFLSAGSIHTSRLLVCDDSPVERMALSHFLRGAGYGVEEAADGQAALLHLKHRPVDLLVLDLHMPGVDGFSVLKYLAEHRPGLPVILMSGMALHDIQPHIHSLPNHKLPPLFIKPVDAQQVLEIIEMQLAGEMPDLGDEPPATMEE